MAAFHKDRDADGIVLNLNGGTAMEKAGEVGERL
jgi:hypothetical protein